MGIKAMTVALIFLMAGAGCLLWTLLSHFEEIHPVSDHEVSDHRRSALLFLALTGLVIVGTLALVLVEAEQLFTSAPA